MYKTITLTYQNIWNWKIPDISQQNAAPFWVIYWDNKLETSTHLSWFDCFFSRCTVKFWYVDIACIWFLRIFFKQKFILSCLYIIMINNFNHLSLDSDLTIHSNIHLLYPRTFYELNWNTGKQSDLGKFAKS